MKREIEEFKKSELVANLAKNFNLKKTEAADVVDFIFNQIDKALVEGRSFTQRKFGRFTPIFRERRGAMNVAKGTSIDIPSRWVPVMKFSKTLRNKVKDAANERSW